jgi:hypothetical protein
MNFHDHPLVMTRTTEEKLRSIEKQLLDVVYPVGGAWHDLLIHLRDVYKNETINMKTNEQIMNELQGTPFEKKTIYQTSLSSNGKVIIVIFTDGVQTNVKPRE